MEPSVDLKLAPGTFPYEIEKSTGNDAEFLGVKTKKS